MIITFATEEEMQEAHRKIGENQASISHFEQMNWTIEDIQELSLFSSEQDGSLINITPKKNT